MRGAVVALLVIRYLLLVQGVLSHRRPSDYQPFASNHQLPLSDYVLALKRGVSHPVRTFFSARDRHHALL